MSEPCVKPEPVWDAEPGDLQPRELLFTEHMCVKVEAEFAGEEWGDGASETAGAGASGTAREAEHEALAPSTKSFSAFPIAVMVEPRARASYEQYAALVEFMERHGDLAKLQSTPQGRSKSDQLWGQLTGMLNGSGVSKPVDKWKKVWADWKTKTKSKARNIRNHSSGTGGGQMKQRLNGLEARVLAVMGPAAVSRHTNVERQTHSQQAQTQSTEASSISTRPQSQDTNIDNGFNIEESVCQPSHQSPAETPPAVAREGAAPPRPRRVRPRGLAPLAPLARAVTQLVRVERRRVRLEETREGNSHRLETERLHLERERLGLERERIQIFRTATEVGRALLTYLTGKDDTVRLGRADE